MVVEVHCCAVEFTPVTSSYRICMLPLYAAFAGSRNVDNVPSATAARASYLGQNTRVIVTCLGLQREAFV